MLLWVVVFWAVVFWAVVFWAVDLALDLALDLVSGALGVGVGIELTIKKATPTTTTMTKSQRIMRVRFSRLPILPNTRDCVPVVEAKGSLCRWLGCALRGGGVLPGKGYLGLEPLGESGGKEVWGGEPPGCVAE